MRIYKFICELSVTFSENRVCILPDPSPVVKQMKLFRIGGEAESVASVYGNVRRQAGDQSTVTAREVDEFVGAEVFHDFYFALDECAVGGGGLEIFWTDADGQRLAGIFAATLAENRGEGDRKAVAGENSAGINGSFDQVHLRAADEGRDESVHGPLINLRRRADLLDGPLVKNNDFVRQRHGLGLIVRDVENRRAESLV